MLHFSKFKSFSILAAILLGLYFLIPNFFSNDEVERFPSYLSKTKLELGLDLQGGSYLLLQVVTDEVIKENLELLKEDVRQVLRERKNDGRISFRNLVINGNTVKVRIVDPAQLEAAEKRIKSLVSSTILPSGLAQKDYSYEVNGNEISVLLLDQAIQRMVIQAVDDSIEVIRRRIDPTGTKEPSIQKQGSDRIIVQVAGDSNPEALKQLINKTGKLTFQAVDDLISPEDITLGIVPSGRSAYPIMRGGGTLAVENSPIITGDMVSNANAALSDDGGYEIRLQFDQRGAKRFGDFSADNIGKRFAIILDEEIIIAPVIVSAVVTGNPRITGRFSADEAGNLAILIRSGALPAPLVTLEQRSVGPDLGADSIRAGSIALIISFLAVILFMIISYGRFGLYADISLIINIVLLFACLTFFGSTLTLPGIAGIVLTVGMAVDANVIIFERIREEISSGKRPIDAVELGFNKALSAILDANITTLIAALIMLNLGAGPVRGFAVTLAIGVITSVFSAYFITRLIISIELLKNKPTKLTL